MESVHFSCQSDKVNDTDCFGGIIIYGLGKYKGMNGGRFSKASGNDKYRAGYVIIKNTTKMDLLPRV